jgi:hypothetical protein
MVLNIGKQFSVEPAGRYITDGQFSGELFRESLLKDSITELADGARLIVVLDDGVGAYSSTWLREAFGGLVATNFASKNELKHCLEFQYEDEDFEFYEAMIWEYINQPIDLAGGM